MPPTMSISNDVKYAAEASILVAAFTIGFCGWLKTEIVHVPVDLTLESSASKCLFILT